MGQTTFITKNIFLYRSDIASNSTCNHIGAQRALSTTLAHEIMHVLVEHAWLFQSRMAYFDKNSLSSFGLLWKEEGYAEYIADGPALTLDEGLKILQDSILLEKAYVPHVEYFKYWLAVSYLIVKKNMTFKEILDANLKLDNVLEEAIINTKRFC